MAKLHHYQDVRAFHLKFGLLTHDSPVHLTKRKLAERVQFLLEELNEFADGCGLYIHKEDGQFEVLVDEPAYGGPEKPQNLAGQADALVDLVYVALGTAVMLGLPWTALWDDVQRANMAKERGVTHRGHAVDVRKPEGWQPPLTGLILQEAGYNVDRPGKEKDDDVT